MCVRTKTSTRTDKERCDPKMNNKRLCHDKDIFASLYLFSVRGEEGSVVSLLFRVSIPGQLLKCLPDERQSAILKSDHMHHIN